MKIVIVTDYYRPGFRGGGPIRSSEAMVRCLTSGGHDVRVFARDHDLGGIPLSSLGQLPAELTAFGGSSDFVRAVRLVKEIVKWRPDAIHFSSAFSTFSSIAPLLARKAGVLSGSVWVMAPRGELMPGAMSIRGSKKKGFLRTARAMGLFSGLRVHATSALEFEQLRNMDWMRGADVRLAPQVPAAVPVDEPSRHGTEAGVFVSRISRKKNLHTLIAAVLETPYSLDIYGSFEDPAYEQTCRGLVPVNEDTRVRFKGEVEPQRVSSLFAHYKFLALPSFGENFGHAIHEALCEARPVLIGDDTPFSDVHGVAGIVVDPRSKESVRDAYAALSALESLQYDAYSRAALTRARNAVHEGSVDVTLDLFRP